MKIIVGLGNPGKKYEKTRHNVGFMFVEHLAEKYQAPPFQNKSKFTAEVTDVSIDGERFLFVKPQTFMNRSGLAVKKILDFYNASTDDLIVVHDDLDIALGEYKVQKGRGPKDHNGLISVKEHVGASEFMRVRIGVDNRKDDTRQSGSSYVLSNFTQNSMALLEKAFDEASIKLV